MDARATIRQSAPVDVSRPYAASALRGKTIVITGGARGLGAAMATAWAAHGAHVVVGDVDDAAGEALVAGLRAARRDDAAVAACVYRRCDVTDWAQQVALFEAAVATSPRGAVDVVVANAGVLLVDEGIRFEEPVAADAGPGPGTLPRPSTAVLDVNVVGVAYTAHLALHHLARNPRPDRCLLLVGSFASIVPLPGQAQYTMSKHAVAGLFRSLRGTAALRYGIRVNMVAPYYVGGTRMLQPLIEAAYLAGSAGPASVPDVVDAATRLIADVSVAGRALVVGPRLKSAPPGEIPVADAEGHGQGRAAWECYAHDYDEVETFTWRYVRLLNVIATARGSWAWIRDLWSIFRRS
ncbi:short chain dehydrogenase [Hirsutella rhossiliensis]|uniref:Short chain dehydrogenase domain-containing protein n=1 Tax=Hirsutella rhossiliensis TaxID=111463 RepID=A0A9P8MZQ3_9HYPO|nr:short chain dehydrogenase domain-containing protein [Hirsutella rhossiliensis]KAH0964262.1 short chain dehydrogenase domain-containing protein [Hirsutella rhossiliensis]